MIYQFSYTLCAACKGTQYLTINIHLDGKGEPCIRCLNGTTVTLAKTRGQTSNLGKSLILPKNVITNHP